MRAIAVARYGAPLVLLDVPEPVPEPGEVVLRVLTCGICATDVKIARGRMPFSDRLRLPHVCGHEVFGEVVASNPPGLVAVGTRTIVYQYWPCGRCGACVRGDEVQCSDLAGWMGFVQDGGMRERIAVPADRLIAVPAGIEPRLAAPMSCAMGTAYRAVHTRGAVRLGSTVAVIGLGGVGIHAAQIAAASGAEVVGFDVHPPTLEAAAELGLVARIPTDDAADDLIAGGGVDVVIDTVGLDASLSLAERMTRRGGTIVLVGYAAKTSLAFATRRMVLDEIAVRGSRYASRDEMARAVAMVAGGSLQPVVGMVRPLARANEALDALEAGEVVGRAVLDVAGVT